MRSVLFVDDDASVINAMQRVSYATRDEWESVFVESAPRAFERLERQRFDLVVSDMRMHGMDGPQFLNKVAEAYPHMIRFILSGFADRGTTAMAAGPAHQFLSKPCEPDTLFKAIRRSLSLRERVGPDHVSEAVGRIRCLPSQPTLFNELNDVLLREGPSVAAVTDVMSKDLGMTTKILQLVNSAFFGLPRHVDSLGDAISFLGIDTIRAIVASTGVFRAYESLSCAFGIEALHTHSLKTGALARHIAIEEGMDKRDHANALMAGLLHDIGKLVLAAEYTTSYDVAYKLAERDGRPLNEVEKERLGACHADVGAYLLGLWGFEDGIVEAVAYHHSPNECCSKEFSLLTIVHIANALVHEGVELAIDEEYVSATGRIEAIESWRQLQAA